MSAQELITDHLDLWTGAITKKSTSGRGGNGKIELTGIKKLRELVLELAVRGVLVPQSSNDTPAKILLEELLAERERLANDSKVRSPKSIPATDLNRLPSKLPTGWAGVTLSHLGIFSGGKTPSKSRSEFWGGDILWVTPKDMKSTEITASEDHVTQDALNAGGLSLLPENSVLFVVRSGILRRMFPTAVTRVQCTINQDLKALQLFKPEMARYIQVLSWGFERFILEKLTKTGTTVESLKFSDFADQPFPLPPLEEQHRIVQKVDELMALCDRLEQQTSDQLEAHETLVDTLLGTLSQSENATELADNWARLAAHFDTLFTTEQSIDKLKQTILQLAVMGRLVEQDAGDEPTAQLLERVSNEKQRLVKSKVLKRTKSLAPLDTSALSPLPESWSWVNLGDLISVMDAGWSPACPPRPADPEKWGVLKTTAVQVMKYQEFENKQLPDNKAPKEQYEVRSGDILITRAGPKNRVGISCVVKETRDKLMISDKIIRFHLIEAGFSEEYICLCLNAGETFNYLEQAKSGMAESQMNISQDKLKAAPIPLCPANEQHRIVQKVDELMALCDQLKERLNQASETRRQLAKAVVEGALQA